jgi:hypothetical protein
MSTNLSEDAVDRRVAALFEGNAEDGVEVKRISTRSGKLKSKLNVQLSLDWWRTSRWYAGAIHPDGSVYCSDFSELDRVSRQALDGAIASEPRRIEASWRNEALKHLQNATSKITLRTFDHSWHHHRRCSPCGTSGELHCHYCSFGQRVCSACCGAGGSRHHDGVSKTYWLNCGGCGGRKTCLCGYCNGRTKLKCNDCNGHGLFTDVYNADITAEVSAGIHRMAEDRDGVWDDIISLPLPQIVAQSSISDTGSELQPGSIAYSWEAATRYSSRTYGVEGWEFDVNVVGAHNSIPKMPPILDKILKSFCDRILEENNSAQVLRLAGQRSLTRSILAGIAGTGDSDLKALRQRVENAVSEGLINKLKPAIQRAFDQSFGAAGKRVWLRGSMLLNFALILAAKAGAFSVDSGPGSRPTSSHTEGMILLGGTIVVLLVIALFARYQAIRGARKILRSTVRRCPEFGWMPKACVVATCFVATYLVATDVGPMTSATQPTTENHNRLPPPQAAPGASRALASRNGH